MSARTQNLFSDPQYAPRRAEKGPKPAPNSQPTRVTSKGTSVRACGVCGAKEGYDHPLLGTVVELVLYSSRSGDVQLCQRCLTFAKEAKQ